MNIVVNERLSLVYSEADKSKGYIFSLEETAEFLKRVTLR